MFLSLFILHFKVLNDCSQSLDETNIAQYNRNTQKKWCFLLHVFHITMTDTCVLGPTSPSRSDGSKGPGGSSPAAWLPVHHLHSGHHQKRPSQTHHSAGAAVPQRHSRCQSAAQRRSPGGQLASVPERDPAHCAALWCGGVLSLTGHRSRRLPGRRKYRIPIQCAKYRRFRGGLGH